MNLTLNEIVKAVKGKINKKIDLGLRVKRVIHDSRKIKSGDLFVAIVGKKYDGHSFLKQAQARGAIAAIISKPHKTKITKIKVNDTTIALGDIAKFYRQKNFVQIIGITGSNGKSTTKEILSFLLASKFKTESSQSSFNNFIGVPLTMFKIQLDTQVLVQEMETNIIGGINRLCDISKPLVGVITNIGSTHLQSLKSKNGVYKEKSELIKNLPSWGVSILNRDDDYYADFKNDSGANRIITFGLNQKADFSADNIDMGKNFISFVVNKKEKFHINTLFHKNIYNVLAAISVSSGVFGLKLKDASRILKKFKFLPLRSEIINLGSLKIINDSFNANPASMKEAINTLLSVEGKRKIAVLGDMKELGKKEIQFHKEIGVFCFNQGIDILIAIGDLAKYIALGAENVGMKSNNINYCKSNSEAVKLLNVLLRKGDVVLFKGSRSMRLEEIVNKIRKDVGRKKT